MSVVWKGITFSFHPSAMPLSMDLTEWVLLIVYCQSVIQWNIIWDICSMELLSRHNVIVVTPQNIHVSVPLSVVALHDTSSYVKKFPPYWPFVWGIYRTPMNSPYKGQWRRALWCSLICAWKNGWVNNGEAGDLRHFRANHDVTVILGFAIQ